MPEPFSRTYTDQQRDALAEAFEDRRIRPASRVVELAEAGELVEGLAAFTVHGGAGTVRDLAHKLRERRAAEHSSELAKQPPRDAIEVLRRRLVTVCEQEINALEKTTRGERDPERIRQLARAIREAAAIPGPTDPTPPRPGHGAKDPQGRRGEGATRGGLAGGVLAQAHREAGGGPINAGDQAAPDHPADVPGGDAAEGYKVGGGSVASQHADGDTTADSTNSPGGWARAEVERLAEEGIGAGAGSPAG